MKILFIWPNIESNARYKANLGIEPGRFRNAVS